ncbi:signal transduction histidine kinase [Glaciihabitans tibetensis]|uniref:Oxygen sensor histidine kinase NreB n=1 Tax=Glaciihabitans tibetensis TaxID=1266600 RepID=A0A2T0VB99_9MICO|nr:sensor histidine kinase [Glaciihabitans tibetensis]PRY67476.1 signal transduction histidine kinase [Glaciihabitans tibetensis]
MRESEARPARQSGAPWWDIFFSATMVLLVLIASQRGSSAPAVLTTLGVISIGYVVLGRRARDDSRFAVPFVALLILGSGIATSFNPSMATIQVIAFPLIWVVMPGIRAAVIANAALAIAVAVGFVYALDGTPSAYQQALTIEVISLVGSVALGIWMTRIEQLSDERQLLLDELTVTQGRLAQLHRESGATSERERLARDIHDTIAQSLTGIVMLSQHAQRELQAGDLGSLERRLEALETNAREALVETRSLVTAGAPVELGEGIVAALGRLVERFVRDTGINASFEADAYVGSPGRLSRDAEVVLLRSAQESLANIRKHSAATVATLTVRADGDAVVLTAADNGIGFDAEAQSTGHGLPGMRDRLALAGGTLVVATAPGAGTTLRATLPLELSAGAGAGAGADSGASSGAPVSRDRAAQVRS